MLGIVTCLFNPAGYERTTSKYQEFRRHLRHDCVVTAELSWDGVFQSEDGIHLHGDESHILWQKERLLNLAIEALPDECDKVAWIDADLVFRNPNWIHQAEMLLDDYPVVQLFESVVDLGPDNRPLTRTPSWGSARAEASPDLGLHQVGHAWAIRRDLLGQGLFDRMVTGGGDWLMASAWLGRMQDWLSQHLPASLRDDFQSWAIPQYQAVQGRVGCVPGEILHLYHGDKKQRRYLDRYEPLRTHAFQPQTDLRQDSQGLWVWAGNKPELAQEIQAYFYARREDDRGASPTMSTMTENEQQLLQQHLADSTAYLEFGMGQSTQLACRASGPQSIDTIESSADYLKTLLGKHQNLRQAQEAGRLTVHVPDIGPTGDWGYPDGVECQSQWKDYPDLIHQLDRAWDTVLVDGRFRVAAVMNLLLCVDCSTRILIHDFWNRNHYHVLLNYLDTVQSVDTMGVFTRRRTCRDDELLKIRQDFYGDPR